MAVTSQIIWRWIGAALSLLAAAWASTAFAAPACSIGTAGVGARVAIGDSGRTVLIHLPQGYDAAKRAPLVFLLHGSGNHSAQILKASGLAATADKYGFIVAAPDGGIALTTGFAWNIPGVPTIAGTIPGPDDADDVKFVGAAIDWLAAAGCIDPARVYAAGESGGGRMTSWLGCVAADRIAAIAPVVGLRAGNPLAGADPARPDPATCRPSAPMPLIAFAGDSDSVNPTQGGGAGYWQYDMHAAEQRWAELNGCTAAPATTWIVPERIYEERYSGCREGADVVARITVGGGHSWIADNDAMWAFLSRHRRPAADSSPPPAQR